MVTGVGSRGDLRGWEVPSHSTMYKERSAQSPRTHARICQVGVIVAAPQDGCDSPTKEFTQLAFTWSQKGLQAMSVRRHGWTPAVLVQLEQTAAIAHTNVPLGSWLPVGTMGKVD